MVALGVDVPPAEEPRRIVFNRSLNNTSPSSQRINELTAYRKHSPQGEPAAAVELLPPFEKRAAWQARL